MLRLRIPRFQVTLRDLLSFTTLIALLVWIALWPVWKAEERPFLIVVAIGSLAGLALSRWFQRQPTLIAGLCTALVSFGGYAWLTRSLPGSSVAAVGMTSPAHGAGMFPALALTVVATLVVVLATGIAEIACLAWLRVVYFHRFRWSAVVVPLGLVLTALGLTGWAGHWLWKERRIESWEAELVMQALDAKSLFRIGGKQAPNPMARQDGFAVEFVASEGSVRTCRNDATLKTWAMPDGPPDSLWLTNRGRQLEVFYNRTGGNPPFHRRYDTQTGAMLCENGAHYSGGTWRGNGRWYVEKLHTDGELDPYRLRDAAGEIQFEGVLPPDFNTIFDGSDEGLLLCAKIGTSSSDGFGHTRVVKRLAVWDPEKEREIWSRDFLDAELVAPAISGDGRYVGCRKELFDTQTGECTRLPGIAVAVTANGRYVVLREFTEQTGGQCVYPAALCDVPILKRLVVLSEAGYGVYDPWRLMLFDVQYQRVVKTTRWLATRTSPRRGDYGATQVTVSPSGEHLLVIDHQQIVLAWRLP